MNRRRPLRSFICISLVLLLACTPFFSADAFGQAPQQTPQGDSADIVQEQPVETDQQAGDDNEATTDADLQDDKQLAEEEPAVETETEETAEEPSGEAKTEYRCSVDGVAITAVLSEADIIPDDAKLSAARITNHTSGYNYDAYLEALNAGQETVYSQNNTLLYDIAFIKDGKEIQPDSGTVTVTFDFKDDQLTKKLGVQKASDLNVIHLPLKDKIRDQYNTTANAKDIESKDINVEEVTKKDNNLQVSVEREKVTFDLESFSVVAVTGREPGATYDVPAPDAQTFTDSTLKLLDGGDFGEMANFGLIAFSQLDLHAHTNSNFAAKKVDMTNAAGTNNLQVAELFYIQDEITGGNNFNMTKGANGSGAWNGSQIVFGSGINITSIDSAVGSTSWKFNIGSTQFNINGPKLEDKAIRQESEGQKFIDLEAYQATASALSKKYSEYTSTKISKEEGAESVIIERSDATIASYNIDAADLTKKIVVNDSNVDGRDHVFIISIDAAGEEEVKIPGLSVTSNGYTGEVSEWTKGNVILNIYDSSAEDKQYRGKVTAEGLISASILCPYASFATNSNVNGQIIADKILIGGEFHRDSITFNQPITIKGGLKAAKELNGSRNLENQVFEFKLTGVDGAPMPDGADNPSTYQSELDGLILFGYITFPSPGEYKYELEEVIPSDAIDLPDGRKFKDGMIYDTSKYTIGVISDYRSETDRTLVIKSYNIYDKDGNKVDSMTYDAGKTGVVTFKNDKSDGKAAIKATKSFSGWNTESLSNKKFNIIIEAKSFVNKYGEEKWSGNGAQYKLPTTDQGQQWQTGSKSKTVEVSASNPVADFGKLSFIDQNGHADDANLGTYKYAIKEEIPEGASYSADGKTAVKDGIVYDASEHIVTVEFMKVGDKYLVTTTYDNGKPSLKVTNDINQIKVEKKWFTNGTDVTSQIEGNISYKLMKKYASYNPSAKVKIVAGNDQNNFVTKYEGMLEQGSTLVITTPDNNPEVQTYAGNRNWGWESTQLHVTKSGDNTFRCKISDIDQIKDIIAVKANNATVKIEGVPEDTSGVPNDAVVDTFQLTNENNWARAHTDLPMTGIEGGKHYAYTYYVVEDPVPDGYTATYTNNEGINTGTITITNAKEEEEEHANLKVRKTFADGTLDDAEKGLVEFTVNGPDGFSQTKTYAQFKEGVWDLGEVPKGQYTVTEKNAAKDGYILTTTYVVDGEKAQQASADLQPGDDVTIELINKYEEDSDEETAYDKVTITKKDQDGAPLNGAAFKLYADKDLTEAVADYTGGTFSINTEDSRLAGSLPTENGASTTLYLKETAAPAGYNMDTATHPVVITRSAEKAYNSELKKFVTTTTYGITIDGKSEIDITNTQKTGSDREDDSVTITKKDQNGEVLENAQFKLFKDQAGKEEITTYTGGTFSINTEDSRLAGSLPTENGASTTLYLKETKAPPGYNMDTTVHGVTITATITTDYDADQDKYITLTTYEMTIDGKAEIDVTNTQKTDETTKHDSVMITKQDQDGEKLSNAEFKLYKEEACTTAVNSYTGGEFEISTEDEALSEYLPTEDKGTVTLYLKETKAPAGYKMDETAHPVVITTSIKTAYDEEKDAYITTTSYEITIDGKSEIDITNTQKTGSDRKDDSVTITKKDQNGEVLENAQFKLFKDQAGKEEITTYTGGTFEISTKDDELASLLPTKNGASTTLYLKETKAPPGYNMDTTVHGVTITATITTDYDAEQDKYITLTTYEMTIGGEAEIDVTNTQKTGETTIHDKISITKQDQDGEKLSNAEFKLYKEEACTTAVNSYTGGEFEISTEDEALSEYLPAEDKGTVTLYLKETKAPAGYDMDKTAHPVVITTSIKTAYDEEKDAYITTTSYGITIDGKSEIDITNTQKTGSDRKDDSVTITKKDQDGEPLNNAHFKLFEDKYAQTAVAGAEYSGGSFVISTEDKALKSYLPAKDKESVTLYLQETEAPAGYKMDETAHPVVITTSIKTAYDEEKDAYITTTSYEMTIDGEAQIDVTNNQKTGETTDHDSVMITKKDQDGAPLSEAQFELYRDQACTNKIRAYTSGTNGIFAISTEDAELEALLPDKDGKTVNFYLKETKAPAGYSMDKTIHEVAVTAHIQTAYDSVQDKFITATTYEMTIGGKSEIDVKNTQNTDEDTTHGSVTITKKDQDGEPLKDAEFKLYSDEDCQNEIGTYKSGAKGTFTVSTEDAVLQSYLPVDDKETVTLYLKESVPPKGYALDETPHKVMITVGYSTALVAAKNAFVTTTAYAMTIDGDTSADITNEEEQKGIITLKKTGKEDAPLNGAEFDLYRVDENSENGDEKVNDNPLVTVNNGTITVGNLEPGTYYFIETKAPKGYVTPEGEDAKTGTAEVLAGQSTPQVCTINFANAEEGKGQIILTKKDKNSSEVLEGASFDLYKVKEGNETEDVKQNTVPYVTDENGVITANNLEPGDYYFVETEAPKEYALPEDPKTETVTIKAGQKDPPQIIRIYMTNERAYGRLLLTKEIEEYIGGKSTNATFTFRITGGSKEDGTFFDESRGVHFDADSNKAQTISMVVPLGIELNVEEVFTGNYEPENKSQTLDPENLLIHKEEMIDIDPNTGETIKIPYYKVSFKNNLVRTNKTKSIINEYGGETVIVDRIGKDD